MSIRWTRWFTLEGEVAHMFEALVRDLTARNQFVGVTNLDELVRHLIDASPTGIAVGKGGRYAYVNSGLVTMLPGALRGTDRIGIHAPRWSLCATFTHVWFSQHRAMV